MKLGNVSFIMAAVAIFLFVVEVASDEKPSGLNPISYPLGGNVNAGSPVTITWKPSTEETVTIHVLKGPPDNLSDLGPIAAKIANSGSFVWDVPKTYQDSSSMPAGDKYGLKIIDDATGKFEYSPAFDMTVPGSTFGGVATGSKTSAEVPTKAASRGAVPTGTASTSAGATASATRDASETKPTETTQPSASSASSILGGGGSGGRFGLEKLPDLGIIFAASGAGVGGLIIIIVIAAVWARINNDRNKAEYHNPKSFRNRRSGLEAETPITGAHHRRLSSTSSFGDGARPSEVFSMRNRSPLPPSPMPTVPPPKLRNPPPSLGPPLALPTNSLPPPISPLPTAMIPRNPSYSGGFPFPSSSQPCAPYAARVYTPGRSNFESHAL